MTMRTADDWQTVENGIPRIPVGRWLSDALDWLQSTFSAFFDALADLIETTVDLLAGALDALPALAMVVVLAVIAWLLRDWKAGLTSAVGLALVVGMDQWHNAMETLALVLIATLVALLIGVPLGVAAASWTRVSAVVRPVMDLMQTMPAMVWLVPFVMLFSIGVSAGLVATVVFALPPAVRLTELGIRQVDAEVVEAGHAFGATRPQILRGIQLPLALPTVMAGVNQVIMLALSMAVIAGLVGGGGLGSEVTSSIASLNVGLGFEAGLAVVILAIYLDRVTAAVGTGGSRRKPLLRRLRERRTAQPATTPVTGPPPNPSPGAEGDPEPASAEDAAVPAR